MAVLLTFNITVEEAPPYPSTYNKLALSLWQLANLQFEQRRDECEGTGDRRMDVILIYLPRADYDAAISNAAADRQSEAAQLADQL